jgi:hypothetical protein
MSLFLAYVAVTPTGSPCADTIRRSADDAWRALCAVVTEPETLRDRGWTVQQVECRLNRRDVWTIEEFSPQTAALPGRSL